MGRTTRAFGAVLAAVLACAAFSGVHGQPNDTTSSPPSPCPPGTTCGGEKCSAPVEGNSTCCQCTDWKLDGSCKETGWLKMSGEGSCDFAAQALPSEPPEKAVECPDGVDCEDFKCKEFEGLETCCKCTGWNDNGSCLEGKWERVKGDRQCRFVPSQQQSLNSFKGTMPSEESSMEETTTESPQEPETASTDAQSPVGVPSEESSMKDVGTQQVNENETLSTDTQTSVAVPSEESSMEDVGNPQVNEEQTTSTDAESPVPAHSEVSSMEDSTTENPQEPQIPSADVQKPVAVPSEESSMEDVGTKQVNEEKTPSTDVQKVPPAAEESSMEDVPTESPQEPQTATADAQMPSVAIPSEESSMEDVGSQQTEQTQYPGYNVQTIVNWTLGDSPVGGQGESDVAFSAPVCPEGVHCEDVKCQKNSGTETCCKCNAWDVNGACIPGGWAHESGPGTCDFLLPNAPGPVSAPRNNTGNQASVDPIPWTPCPKELTCETTRCAWKDGVETCCDCLVWKLDGSCKEDGWKARDGSDCGFIGGKTGGEGSKSKGG